MVSLLQFMKPWGQVAQHIRLSACTVSYEETLDLCPSLPLTAVLSINTVVLT